MQRILTLLVMVAVAALLMNGCSDSSDSPTTTGNNEDLTPPTAPVSLSVHVEDNVITLAWTENSEVDLDGYNVYRSTNNSSFEMAGSIDQARYEDSVPGQGVYHFAYRVTAMDDSGNESTFSVTDVVVDASAPHQQESNSDPLQW